MPLRAGKGKYRMRAPTMRICSVESVEISTISSRKISQSLRASRSLRFLSASMRMDCDAPPSPLPLSLSLSSFEWGVVLVVNAARSEVRAPHPTRRWGSSCPWTPRPRARSTARLCSTSSGEGAALAARPREQRDTQWNQHTRRHAHMHTHRQTRVRERTHARTRTRARPAGPAGGGGGGRYSVWVVGDARH
jgi:hypothetical protein